MKTFRQIREQEWESPHKLNPRVQSALKKPKPSVIQRSKLATEEEKKKTLKNTNPCWKGYHPVGTKEKNGRTVPNCVPEETVQEVAAWQRKEGKNPEGGLNKKGIMSYRREHPGSKLSLAVTKKPSEMDPDSKAAKRRKSFCARMGGMKKRLTSAKTAHDPDSRINKALRKWHC